MPGRYTLHIIIAFFSEIYVNIYLKNLTRTRKCRVVNPFRAPNHSLHNSKNGFPVLRAL